MRQRRHHSCRRCGGDGGRRSHGSRECRYQMPIGQAIRMLVAVINLLHVYVFDRVSRAEAIVHAHAQDPDALSSVGLGDVGPASAIERAEQHRAVGTLTLDTRLAFDLA